MWKLIKADIEYNRSLFAFLYTGIILAAVINSFMGGREEYLAVLMFFSVVIIGVTAGLEEMNSKRIRLYTGLPVPIRRLGIFRYPVFTVYWISLMVLLWISTLIGQPTAPRPDLFLWLVTRTSTLLIWIACMNLAQDLPFCINSKSAGYFLKWICNLGGAFAGPLIFFLSNPRFQSDPFFASVAARYNTAPWALGWLLLSLGLMVFSVFIYQQRRSYTE